MTILYCLIPVTLALGLAGLAAFFWSLSSGQYEDLAGAAERILLDEDDRPPEPARSAGQDDRDRGGLAMIAQLTGIERRVAMVILGVVALAGLVMAAVGRGDPLGVHGFIVLAFSGALFLLVGGAIYDPEPSPARFASLLRRPDQGRASSWRSPGRSSAWRWGSGSRRCSPGRSSGSTAPGRASGGCARCTPRA